MAPLAVFSPRQEKISLWLPIFLFIFTILDLLGFFPWMTHTKFWINVITAILLLDSVHAVFTFYGLFALPELREWRQEFRKQYTVPLEAGLALSGLVFFFFGAWAARPEQYLGVVKNGNAPDFALLALALVVRLMPLHHGIRQSFGIAKIYDSLSIEGKLVSSFNLEKFKAAQVWERRGFNAYLFIIMGYVFYEVAIVKFEPLHRQSVRFLVAFATLSICVGLVWNSLRVFSWRTSNKPLYLLRLFHGALMPCSAFGAIAIKFWHGIEYFFIFFTMRKNSQGGWSHNRFWGIGFSLIFIFSLLHLFRPWIFAGYFHRNEIFEARLIQFFAGLSVALTFTHYWFDGILFRMRDPLTRAHVGKLLLTKPAAPLVGSSSPATF